MRLRAPRPRAPPPAATARDDLECVMDVFSPSFARSLRLDDRTMASLADLPGTTGPAALRDRAVALGDWRARLGRGVLPDPEAGPWPDPVLAQALVTALESLDMPRFCARHPGLLDALLRQLLELVRDYERRLADEGPQDDQDADAAARGDESQPPPDDSAAAGAGGAGQAGDERDGDGDAGDAFGEGVAEPSDEQAGGQGRRVDADAADAPRLADASAAAAAAAASSLAESIATDLVDQLIADWRDVARRLADAERAFDAADLSSLLDGPAGFDRSHAAWGDDGWVEVAALTTVLERCRELRDLVRSLGRAAGRGPMRRAPAQVETRRGGPGVLRSPLSPEETSGLARSGDLARMLPAEAALVAAGWPKARAEGDAAAGSRPARMLHMARRAERTLLSYERSGWVDEDSTRATHRTEVRPAAELGPIILCLDTSGSMAGARETVAKAVALECMRSAHRARRRALLYAFSGPGDVRELALAPTPDGLADLLAFLRCSFGGGTDADAPLALALERIEAGGWGDADVLLVTDGELPPPSPAVKDRLEAATTGLGLEVHALLVGRADAASDGVRAIATDVHVFRSWSAVDGV